MGKIPSLVGLVLVAGFAVGVFGLDRLKVYFARGRAAALAAVDRGRALETDVAVLEQKLAGLDDDVDRLQEKAVRLEVSCERLEREFRDKKDSLSRFKDQLVAARQRLLEKRDSYLIGGHTYSLAEVREDAKRKMEVFAVQKQEVEDLEEILRTQREALELARRNVGQAQSLRVELQTRLRMLKSQIEKLKTKQEWLETAPELFDVGDLGSRFEEIKKKVRQLQEEVEVRDRMIAQKAAGAEGAPDVGIDYTPATPLAGEDPVLSRLDELLTDEEEPKRSSAESDGGDR